MRGREFSLLELDYVVRVTENNKVIGGIAREKAHRIGLLHREVAIFLINRYGLLLQKRVDTKRWNHIGGHPEYYIKIKTPERWKPAAVREFKEEVGYLFNWCELKEYTCYRRDVKKNNRFEKIFLSQEDIESSKFKRQKSAVLEIKYHLRPDLDELLKRGTEVEEGIMGGTKYILTELCPELTDLIPDKI